MSALPTVLIAFIAMEPLAAVSHRCLMHGPGWGWHRSHHRVRRSATWERNDLYPLVFAAVTIAAMAAARAADWTSLLWVGIGVTLYGAAYTLVHDVGVHGRLTGGRPALLPGVPLLGRWLNWVAACHAVHHRYGVAPYGFLAPIVPARHRAVTSAFVPVATRARPENTS